VLVPRGRFDSSDSEDDSDFEDGPAPKRYRLTYEEAKAALKVPVSYKEALKAPEKQEWRDAIKTELKALRDKKTFTMVKRDPSMKVIG
jgi:hypothetical protein